MVHAWFFYGSHSARSCDSEINGCQMHRTWKKSVYGPPLTAAPGLPFSCVSPSIPRRRMERISIYGTRYRSFGKFTRWGGTWMPIISLVWNLTSTTVYDWGFLHNDRGACLHIVCGSTHTPNWHWSLILGTSSNCGSNFWRTKPRQTSFEGFILSRVECKIYCSSCRAI